MPADIVGDIIRGALTFVLKTQHTPDLSTICDALRIAQTEAKSTAENTAQALDEIKDELRNTAETVQRSATNIQQNINTGEEARAAAKEATEVGRATLEMTREIKNKSSQGQANGPTTYAAAAARGLPIAATYNTQSLKAPSLQTQREVIVNIRDPLTIQSLRAMNPRNLKVHVERAIEQSGNENIASVKIVSSNQLKSGDLSIKTATSSEVEALRQFADDWAYRIGSGATVQIPTYGVLAHGIRTSTMDMDKFKENRIQILQDNRPFIPRAEIKHIGWLTRDASAKTASTACGYCAQEHDTRDCPSKSDRNAPRKCALCRSEHEVWSRQCPTRKDEIAKAKTAYEMRPRYHHIAGTGGRTVQLEIPATVRKSRFGQNAAPL